MVDIEKIIFRAIVYFCSKDEVSPHRTHMKLQKYFKVFGFCKETIENWYESVKTELDIFPEKSHAGRKNDDELEQAIRNELQKSPGSTAARLARVLKKPRSVIQHYLYDVIGASRMRAFTIPHELTEKLRIQRVNFAKIQLSMLKIAKEANYRNIITGDESWFKYSYYSLYFYVLPGNKRPTIVKDQRGLRKIMLIIFFNGDGPLLVEALEHNQTITSDRMEHVILPKLHNAYQHYYNTLSKDDQTQINDCTNRAFTEAARQIKLLHLPLKPTLPDQAKRPRSDGLFLSTTSLFPDEDENEDDYHDEHEQECIVISSDDDEEEEKEGDRHSKRKCKELLQQLAKEDAEFRRRLRAEEQTQKKETRVTKGKPVSREEMIKKGNFMHKGEAFVHMDNASPHNTPEVRTFMSTTNFIRMPQPPNSPDLAPCDYYLFSRLKQALEEEDTDDRETLLAAVNKILKTIPPDEWRRVFDNWITRLEWVIEHDGAFYPSHLKEAKKETIIPQSSTLLAHTDTPTETETETDQLEEEINTSSILTKSQPLSPNETTISAAKPESIQTTPTTSSQKASFYTPLMKRYFAAENAERDGIISLKNLGNTCYLNSLLQSLFGIYPLTEFFLSHIYEQRLHEKPAHPPLFPIIQKVFVTAYERTDLFEEVTEFIDPTEDEPDNKKTIPLVLPFALQRYLPHLHRDFSLGAQADQHQLFLALIGQLVCNLFSPSFIIFFIEDQDLKLSRDPFRISSFFEIQTALTTYCPNCRRTSTGHVESSSSLPLSLGSVVSVQDGITQFFQSRKLDSKNRYRCSSCNMLAEAVQHPIIVKLPEVLVLFLQYDAPPDTLTINPHLDFTAWRDYVNADESLTYSLFSITFFKQLDAVNGHYITARYSEDHDSWLIFNDSQVSTASSLPLCISSIRLEHGVSFVPYLLFYKRSTSHWAKPLLRTVSENPISTPQKRVDISPFKSAVMVTPKHAQHTTSPFKTPVVYDKALMQKQYDELLASRTEKIKDFTCSVCHKHYTRKWSLNRHMKSHTGEKPFQCLICKQSFARKDNLQAHVDTHLRIRTFPCPYCRYRGYSSQDVYHHQLKEHPEKTVEYMKKCGMKRSKIDYYDWLFDEGA